MKRNVTLHLDAPGWESVFNRLADKANAVFKGMRTGRITAQNLTDEQRQDVANAQGNTVSFASYTEVAPGSLTVDDIRLVEMLEGEHYTFGTKDGHFGVYQLPDDGVTPWSPGARRVFSPPALPKHRPLYETLRHFGL